VRAFVESQHRRDHKGQFALNRNSDAGDIDLAPAPPQIDDIPLVDIPYVWHWGTLDPSERRSLSYEGPALSVTTAPYAWQRIARLGGQPLNLLTGGELIHRHAITDAQWGQIVDWAIAAGHVARRTAWRVTLTDEDGEPYTIDCETEAEAQEWVDDPDDPGDDIIEVEMIVPLDPDARGMPGDDLALYRWAEAQVIRGIWWDDINDGHMSAPRGGLIHWDSGDIVPPEQVEALLDDDTLLLDEG
jgi:hypothetical protein